MISQVIFKFCCYFGGREIQTISFIMKMIGYNEITDSNNLEIVSPSEKEVGAKEWWRKNLHEGLSTLKSGLFYLSALLLNT